MSPTVFIPMTSPQSTPTKKVRRTTNATHRVERVSHYRRVALINPGFRCYE